MRYVRIALACLLLYVPAAAQEGAGEGKGKGKGKGGTLTGCLTKGDAPGQYVLVNEKTGARTIVTGSADLEKHSANHKVTLTGKRVREGGKTEFQVTAIKHISETCTAASPK